MTSSQFQILRATSHSELSAVVTDALASGWTLVGHAMHHGGGMIPEVWWQSVVLPGRTLAEYQEANPNPDCVHVWAYGRKHTYRVCENCNKFERYDSNL